MRRLPAVLSNTIDAARCRKYATAPQKLCLWLLQQKRKLFEFSFTFSLVIESQFLINAKKCSIFPIYAPSSHDTLSLLQPGRLQQTFEVLTLGIAYVGVRIREVIVITAIATTADASADLLVTPVLELLLVMLQQHE